MSQALYRKWRPATWDEVIGQQHVVSTLRNAVAAERVGHAYLFAGPRGTGKTTLARLLAKAVNCTHDDLSQRPDDQCENCLAVNNASFLDLIEIDAASNTSVEDVRDLRDKINFSPNRGRYKVYIIDEVHMLSTAAFNALLKTLEEPPPHAIFVLATTEVHKIPATVLSRCQRHEFRRIPVVDIVAHLKNMAEGETIQAEEPALELIARQSTGAMRDAISLLDQLSAMGETITLEMAQTVLGTATSQSVLDVIDALQAEDSAAGLDRIHAALDGGSDPRQFARQIVDYLRDVLLVRMGNADQVDASAEERQHMAKHAQGFEVNELLRIVKVFNAAATETRGAWQPSLPLEMAFVEALVKPEAVTSQAVVPTPQAKTPTQTAPASQTTPSKAAPPANDELSKGWPQFVQAVKGKDAQVGALLNSVKAREIRGSSLLLGFASQILKEKMEKDEARAMAEEAAREAYGRSLDVKCFVASGSGEIPPEVDSSGMVATALRLGGEIVDTNELSSSNE
ncbi:MAG: DNA polymerase III subunit gamma/tau [Chloroflexi bacterium]|nr:MAG: DNA polymerase III subunit gamma/tau [Chloroflexota bacterium]MBL1195395.1 DNA polymerase III subunit gamma/tau [Chloroflexota bacterium]NOH12678.1 DNA polymerase III subunit gamma/tau [Chloroflexota bacterium]